MFCPRCGRQNDDRAVYCQACGNPLQDIQTPAAAGAYAGFWQRFLAMLLDWVVVACGSAIASILAFGAVPLAFFAASWLYEAFMLSSEWQATLGKRALSIAVTRSGGAPLSFARASGRHFAKYISGFILLIGYIMAAFTERKQALHDLMADTVVINR